MNALIERLRAAPTSVRAVMVNFGYMLAGRGVDAVISMVYLAIITRTLGVAGFGKFALITGAASILTNLLMFPTWQIIVQYGLAHAENRDEARLGRLYRFALVLDLVGAVAGIAASVVILTFFAHVLGIKPTLSRMTLIFNAVMLISQHSTTLGMLRLRNRFEVAALADATTPVARLIGAIVVCLVHPGVQGFLTAWAVAEMLTYVAYWYAAHRVGETRVLRTRRGALRQVITDNPGIVRYAWTTNFSQSLVTTTRQLPVFLVGGLTGVAAAGAFRLAAQLSRALTFLSQMIARAAFPEIVRAVRNLGVGGIGGMIARTLRFAVPFSAIVFVTAFLFGRQALGLIGGHDFVGAYTSLLWLAGAGCIDVATVAFEPSLAAANRAHFALIVRLVASGVLVGGALVLEPRLGADGVAAAVWVSAVAQALLLGAILLAVIRRGAPRPHPA